MDVYDVAIEHLTKHPDEIHMAWREPNAYLGGSLFRYAQRGSNTDPCGCLTQIRHFPEGYTAQTYDLTEQIAADERIPDDPSKITVKDLPVFAEWQRRLDAELGPYLPDNADQEELDRRTTTAPPV